MDYSNFNMLQSLVSKPSVETSKLSANKNTNKSIEDAPSFDELLKKQSMDQGNTSSKEVSSQASVENEDMHAELLAKLKEALNSGDETSIEALGAMLKLLSSESDDSESNVDLINELINKLKSSQDEQIVKKDDDKTAIENTLSQLMMDLLAPIANDETLAKLENTDFGTLIANLGNNDVQKKALNELLQLISSMKEANVETNGKESLPFMDVIQSLKTSELTTTIINDPQVLSSGMNVPKELNIVVSNDVSNEVKAPEVKAEVVQPNVVTKETVVDVDTASTQVLKTTAEVVEPSKQNAVKEVASENEVLASDKELTSSKVVKHIKDEKSDIETAYEKLSTYQNSKGLNVESVKTTEVPKTLTEFTSEQMKTFDIPAQIKVGIEEQLAKMNNEFVLKLKPEGMGEVVVKLVNNGGNIEINLITNNLQTKNYLNEAMANLKDSLQPFNAQVKEVTYDNQNSYFNQSNFSDQQSSFANPKHSQQSAFYRNGLYENTEEEMNYNVDLLLNSATIARRI